MRSRTALFIGLALSFSSRFVATAYADGNSHDPSSNSCFSSAASYEAGSGECVTVDLSICAGPYGCRLRETSLDLSLGPSDPGTAAEGSLGEITFQQPLYQGVGANRFSIHIRTGDGGNLITNGPGAPRNTLWYPYYWFFLQNHDLYCANYTPPATGPSGTYINPYILTLRSPVGRRNFLRVYPN